MNISRITSILCLHFGLHRQEFLKSQGLDVTEDEIREALSITTTPLTTAWTSTAPVGPVGPVALRVELFGGFSQNGADTPKSSKNHEPYGFGNPQFFLTSLCRVPVFCAASTAFASVLFPPFRYLYQPKALRQRVLPKFWVKCFPTILEFSRFGSNSPIEL